ncbi:MAG: beta-lactamase family protein [Sedimentisphaerales bacterium]|nr:beta-lactamase family protein [Sedimentisphaerales bacterium]
MRTALRALVWTMSVVLPACPAVAGRLVSAVPEEVGLSASRLDRIDKVMQQYVDEGRIAGVVTLIMHDGKVAHHKAFGMSDIEAGAPMTTDAMFRIASMSKPLTATAVMILYEQGRFLLNDPVSKYIPEFARPQVLVRSDDGSTRTEPARREITIRHLLNHTSGLTYGDGPLAPYYREVSIATGLAPTDDTIEQMVKKLARLPLISHPGEEMHYGLSIDVLGYLVEVLSGQDFNTFCTEHIFQPLQMDDTCFVLPQEKLPRLARMYRLTTSEGKLQKDATDPAFLTRQKFFSGGAGVISTASDYARFAQMILNGGKLDGVRIVSRKTVELMTSNSIGELYAPFRYNTGDKMGYGFGIRTERGAFDELESLGIVGWDGAYFTRFWIDAQENLIGVFMTQMDGYWWADLATKYRVLVYQAITD